VPEGNTENENSIAQMTHSDTTTSEWSADKRTMRKLRSIAGIGIVAGWLLSAINSFLRNNYESLQLTTPVMVVFAGFLFGDTILRRRYSDDR